MKSIDIVAHRQRGSMRCSTQPWRTRLLAICLLISCHPDLAQTINLRHRVPARGQAMLEERTRPETKPYIRTEDLVLPSSYHSPTINPLASLTHHAGMSVHHQSGRNRIDEITSAAKRPGKHDDSLLHVPEAWNCHGAIPCDGPAEEAANIVEHIEHKLRGLPEHVHVATANVKIETADDFISRLKNMVMRHHKMTTTAAPTTTPAPMTTPTSITPPAPVDPCALHPQKPSGMQPLPGIFTTRWLSRVVYSECNVTRFLLPGDDVILVPIGNSHHRRHLVRVDAKGDIPHGLLDHTRFVIKEAFCSSGKMKAIRMQRDASQILALKSEARDALYGVQVEKGRANGTTHDGQVTTASPLQMEHPLEQPKADIGGNIIDSLATAVTVEAHLKGKNTSAPTDHAHHNFMQYPWDWRQLDTTASVIEGSYCVVGNYAKDMHVALETVNLATAATFRSRGDSSSSASIKVSGDSSAEELLSSFELAESALVWGGIYDGECIKIGCDHYTVVSGAGPAPVGVEIRPCPPLEDEKYAPIWSGDETIGGTDEEDLLSGGGGDGVAIETNGAINNSNVSGRNSHLGLFNRLVDEIEAGIERTVVNMPLVQPQIDSENDVRGSIKHADKTHMNGTRKGAGNRIDPSIGKTLGSFNLTKGSGLNTQVGSSRHHNDYSDRSEDCMNIGLSGYVIRLDRPYAGRSRGLEPAYRLGASPTLQARDTPSPRSYLPAPKPTGCKISVPPPSLPTQAKRTSVVPAKVSCPCSKWGNASRLIVRLANSNTKDGVEAPLPCGTTTDQLRTYFERFGKIVRINLQHRNAVGDGVCPMTGEGGEDLGKQDVKEALLKACKNKGDLDIEDDFESHLPSVDMRIVEGIPYVIDYNRGKTWNIADDPDARDEDIPHDIDYPHMLRSTYPTKYEKWFTDMEKGKELDTAAMVSGMPKDAKNSGLMKNCPRNSDADSSAQQADCMRAESEKLPGGKPLDSDEVAKLADHSRDVNGQEIGLHPRPRVVRNAVSMLQVNDKTVKSRMLQLEQKSTKSATRRLSLEGQLQFTPGADEAPSEDDPSAPVLAGGRKAYENEMEHNGTGEGMKAAIARAEALPEAPQTDVARAYYSIQNGAAEDKIIDAERQKQHDEERELLNASVTNISNTGFKRTRDPLNPAYHYVGALGPAIPITDRLSGKTHAWSEEDPALPQSQEATDIEDRTTAVGTKIDTQSVSKSEHKKGLEDANTNISKKINVRFGPQPAFPASDTHSTSESWLCSPYAIVQFELIEAANSAMKHLDGTKMLLGNNGGAARDKIVSVRRATRNEARICNFTCNVIAPVVRSNSSTLYHASIKAKATKQAMHDKVKRMEAIIHSRITLVGRARHMRHLQEAKDTLVRLEEWANKTAAQWEKRKALLNNWFGQCPDREEDLLCPEFNDDDDNDNDRRKRQENGGLARCDRISIGDDVFHSYRIVETDIEHDTVILDKEPVLEKEIEALQDQNRLANQAVGENEQSEEYKMDLGAKRNVPFLAPVLRLAEPAEESRLEKQGLEALALQKMKCTSMDCVSRVESEEIALGKAFRQTIGGSAFRVLTIARSRGDGSVDLASRNAILAQSPSNHDEYKDLQDLIRPSTIRGSNMDRQTCLTQQLPGPSPAPTPRSSLLKELKDLNEVLRQPDPIRDDPTNLDARDMDYPKGVGGEEEKFGAFETMADFHDWSASYSMEASAASPDLSKMRPSDNA